MTRAEELDWLYRLKSEICVCMPKEWKNMSNPLNMAIKALEQEPCEDTISRQAVLNTLFYNSDNNCEVVLNKELQDRIKALPHVTPAPKKCHNENWDYDSCDQFVCSNCGIELQDWLKVERDEDGDITFHGYEFKYCPNCGARIGGEE